MTLSAPFPWFGGKSRAAGKVWALLGDVDSYVEPFGGSAAVLLARPHEGKVETYNDADGFLCNFWRAVTAAPYDVAAHCDWPVHEADLSARHAWLVERKLAIRDRVQADPEWFDSKVAGWWVWGACAWIGSGWCSGDGPWVSDGERLINRKLPHLGDAGRGINRQLPHLGDAGMGINRQLPHLGDAGMGPVAAWFRRIADRLRRVRFACGDWRRVITTSCVERHGIAGVYLDPPYPEGWSTDRAYSAQDDDAVVMWEDVKRAAIDLAGRGVRVVVSGYDGTWADIPDDWRVETWTARKGYCSDTSDTKRERLWASPLCIGASRQRSLFA